MTGTSPVTSIMDDSMPISTGPPSSIMSIRPERSSSTCCAVEGDGLPEAFALGAAIYTPLSLMSLAASGWDGILIATVSSPPVVSFGTISFLLNIIVIGPGQNLSISFSAIGGISEASSATSARSAMWTIRGLSDGLPFAA